MHYLHKQKFFLSTLLLAVFLSVLTAGSAHSHGKVKDGDDHCSLCSWQQTGSQAPSTPTPPTVPFYLLVFLLLFTFEFLHFSPICLSLPGRSPPQILL